MRTRPKRAENPAPAVLAAADAHNAAQGAPEPKQRPDVHLVDVPPGTSDLGRGVAICGAGVPRGSQRCVAAIHQICAACQALRKGTHHAPVLFPKTA